MKIAFVLPWFGKEARGGTEEAIRNIVMQLKQRTQIEIEVLTTCSRTFTDDWSINSYQPGVYFENDIDISIRRFRVDSIDRTRFHEINSRLMNGIFPSNEEEAVYIEQSIHSSDLNQFLQENYRHYDGFVFTPYMFGTTFDGVGICRDRAILLPAFHDEVYAYLTPFRMRYAKVKGILFNSQPEKEWAKKHYDLEGIHSAVIGNGIRFAKADGERFKKKYCLPRPYLVYAGRKDTGKNIDFLLRTFESWPEEPPVDLVFLGGGELPPFSSSIKSFIKDLGFVDVQDKYDAMKGAVALVQPSLFESFSLVIMESWTQYTPVLVHSGCSVTRSFVEQSDGGLHFATKEQLKAAISWLLSHPEEAKLMGQQGYQFVKQHYSWETVVQKLEAFFITCFGVNNA